jgi:hypothetical protein
MDEMEARREALRVRASLRLFGPELTYIVKSAEPDTVKVGPKGYTHGWVFHGTAGGADHVSAMESLASHLYQTQGHAAGDEMRAASRSLKAGDLKGTDEHLMNAQRAVSGDKEAKAGIKSHLAAVRGLRMSGIRQQQAEGHQERAEEGPTDAEYADMI